jgi:hypothetical protein
MRASFRSQAQPPPLGARAALVASALAMVVCGATFTQFHVAPLIATAFAVAAIYWFGDVMDRLYRGRTDGRAFPARDPIFIRMGWLGASVLGLMGTMFWLSSASIVALAAVLTLGVIDSIEVPFLRGLYPIGGGGWYRPKKISVLKHLMVGAWWSLLLVVGAGTVQAPGLGVAVVFALIQIAIGALVGYLPAVDELRGRGVRNLATRMGVPGLIRFLRVANGMSALLLTVAALLDTGAASVYLALLIVSVWRTYLFLDITHFGLESGRLRARNLATCFLFPLACMLARVVG